ncbi:MAG: hypothetical protein PHV20_08505 [Bacteroidales bacterium]|nr:hypothetical protein [Bacteroidales bacterium]
MKRIFFGVIFLISLFSCKDDNKAAHDRLQKAKSYCDAGMYNAAKLEIDSIRTLFPKSYSVIKEAVLLIREVERKEQSRNSIYCDDMIEKLSKKVIDLQEDFKLEKENEYQDVGNWVLPSQQVERNIQKSYLRCGVNELGKMYIVAVYYGASPINFTAIRVSTSEDIYAETLPISSDGATNFSFVDNGMTSQIVSFTKKNENGLSGFIRLYAHQNISVYYIGSKPYSYILDEKTKEAVLKTYALSQVMNELQQYKDEKKVADAKLIYLAKKNLKSE